MTAARTTQLRRYRIVPGQLPEFVAWWRARLLPAREAFGFTLEFALAVPETDEFVWAVSVDGDEAALGSLDVAWTASPERATAFEGVPQRVAAHVITVAEPA